MGGSAAVFGATKALGQIKPPGVEVLHFSQPHSCMRCRGFTHINFYDFSLLTCSRENMISGTGMRPSDIVKLLPMGRN
jgi:leucyl aminopeptidase